MHVYELQSVIKWIINKHLLDSTVSSTQYFVITYMGKESEKVFTYIVCIHIYKNNVYIYICKMYNRITLLCT